MASQPGPTRIENVQAKDVFLVGGRVFLAAESATPDPAKPGCVTLEVYCHVEGVELDSTVSYTAAREMLVEILGTAA